MEDIECIGFEIIDRLEGEIGALALSYFASIERINKIIINFIILSIHA